MDLIPEDIRARLLANGAEIAENDDHIPLVKLPELILFENVPRIATRGRASRMSPIGRRGRLGGS